MEYAVSLLLGIGLAASCGFRVFVPLMIASIAGMTGIVEFTDGFEWMKSWTTFGVFTAATIFEIAAYYIPWLDNILDTITKPLAIGAGSLLTISFISDWDPVVKWVLGIIAGGGTAGVIAAGTGTLRAGSSTFTGGVGNWIVATIEHVASLVISILTVIIPVIMGTLMILFTGYVIYKVAEYRSLRRKKLQGNSERIR